MMRENPYTGNSLEHRLWEDWNREFFRQPVHAQVLDIEHELRGQIQTLSHLLRQLEDGELKRALIEGMLAIESSAEELSDIAEHQYFLLVSKEKRGGRPTE